MIEPEGIQGLPNELLERAKDDFEFAARLLHVETRKDALGEVGLESDYDLDQRLSEFANMSLREALGNFRAGQNLQP